jgi:hypothetical protein
MCEMKDEWDRMRRVLLLNPDYAHARDSLGDVYHDQLDGALSEYLRLDPFRSRAVLQLAVTHEKLVGLAR